MEIQKSNEIDKLAKSLSLAQSEMRAVIMNATNPFLHNKYADLGAIIESLKVPLAKNELAFTQLVSLVDTRVGVDTLLLHSSGQWIQSSISLPMGEEKGKSAAQVAGSIITYLRRYSLSAILGVYSEEDSDGTEKKEKALALKVPDEKAIRTELIKKILDRLVELGGSKNEKLLVLVKEYDPVGNPNKIKDQAKLEELFKKLQEFKNEEEKK